MQGRCEDQEKQLKDLKRQQLDLECQLQKESDEKVLMETRVNELEHQNEILNNSLQSQVEQLSKRVETETF